MGALQIIMADNPRPARKGLQSQGKKGKLNRKEGSRMKKPSPAQIKARKKFAAMARARGKAARAAKRGKSAKRKNPYQFVAYKRGVKGSGQKSGAFASKKELSPFRKAVSRKKLIKGRRSKGIVRARAKIRKLLKKAGPARRKAVRWAAGKRKEGYKVKKIYISPKSVLASAKAERGRKRRKRKQTRKESKVAKRRKRKSKARRRKSPRRRKAARRSRRRKASGRRKSRRSSRTILLKRKGQGVYIRRNPNIKAMVEQYSGFKAEELGSLLVGGAVYGTVDGLAAKYAPGIYAMAAKVPVVGTTVVPAAIGVALNIAGKKLKVNALSLLGEGILGAAVVAMGIQASQYLPGIAPASTAGMRGVDFTPGRGVLMGGYARDGADFGNVDFTPGPGVLMGSQPQMGELVQNLGMNAQMGDTSILSRDGADFGLVPEGLGGLG